MSFLGDLYNKAKKKLYDWEQPIQREVSSGLGQAYNSAKNYLSGIDRNVNNYVAPKVQSVENYFSQPERVAKDVFMNTTGFGAADKLMNDWRSPVANYFKPTEQVRARDFAREVPQATFEAAKQIPQFATRFAISAVEAPKAIRTGQATKKFYNTPFGRLNSFQSESQNRVERGDPLWKSIAYPAAKTVLGAADAMMAAKPILGAAKSLSKFGKVGKEVANIADDLTLPLGKTMKKTIPARVENVSPDIHDAQPGIGTFKIGKNGAEKVSGFKMTRETKPTLIPETTVDVPFEFKSKTLRSAQSPGLTIKDISPEAAARRAAYNERQVASAEKAKALVARQMENQRQGLETAEPGFVSPKVVKAPQKPVLEQPPAPAPKQSTLPGIEEFVNGKTEAPKTIQMPDDIKALQDRVDNGELIQPQLYKKLMSWKENPKPANPVFSSEDPFKGNAFGEPNGGKPYNAFQQRAYQAKQERISALKDITTHPQELRAGGYRKAEIERMGIDEGKKKANLLKLGYPKEEIQKMDFDRMDLILKRGVPHETLKNYYQRKHALDTNYLEGVDPTTLKDINPLMTGNRDVFRNFEAAFGQNFPKIKTQLLDPFDAAKGNMISEQKSLLQEVLDNVVNKFGIEKGSELDHAVVAYGEGKIKLPELQELYPNDWKKVTAADEWFRNKYPQLLNDLNAVREENFPTHPLFPESTKIIPQRKDYYRHGKDLEGFAGLRNMFEGSGSIDPALAASSDVTNPKTKWLSFAQRRKGDENDLGAVQGYLDYIKNHSYAKHIDPFIQKFKGVDDEAKQLAPKGGFFHETRGLSEELSKKLDPVQQIADSTDPAEIKNILVDKGVSDLQANWMSKELANIHDLEKARTFLKDKLAKNTGKQLENLNNAIAPAERGQNKENNFLVFIKNFSRNLAGKTNTMDRPVQENIFGRKAFSILNWANSRIKANVILGKTSSSLAQFFNVPQGFASAGARNSAKGLGDSLAGIFRENAPMKQSAFINERTFSGFNKFDTGILANTKKFAIWMLGVGDEIGTKFIWNSHYRKALSEGIPNPIKYADDWSRKMVGGRGIGEMPMVQQSKIVQMIAPFQYEVNNMWFALRDIVKNDPRKLVVAKKIIEFAAASFVMNRIVKEIRGSDVSFDPVNAMVEAYGEFQNEDDKITGAVKAGGRLAGEALSNVMGGQTLASFYPEFGYGLNKENFPTASKFLNNPRKDFFGEGDPTRFGTGSSFLMGTAFKNPLTGFVLPYGGKQLEATYGGAKTLLKGYADNASGKVMTPVAKTAGNIAKGLLFGKNALNEVRDYYDNNGTPLSDLQTEKYKLMGNDYFNEVIGDRKNNAEAKKLKSDLASGKGISGVDISDKTSKFVKAFRYEKLFDQATGDSVSDAKTRQAQKTALRKFYSDENVPDDVKNEIYGKLGVDKGQLELDIVKSLTVVERAKWAKDMIKSPEDTQRLVDNKILTNAVVNEMKISGLISPEDAGVLFGFIKNGTAKKTTTASARKSGTSARKSTASAKKTTTTKAAAKTSSSSSGKSSVKLDEKWRYPLVDPDMMRINAQIAGAGSKTPIITKKLLPLIVRRLPAVRRTSKRRKK